MIERFETEDATDRRFALGATGLLRDFNRAGVLQAADVHVASRLAVLVPGDPEEVTLAVALAVRAARMGSTCVHLDSVREVAPELEWPGKDWVAAVTGSAVTAAGVVHVEGDAVYLDRYWREEEQVCSDLVARLRQPPPAIDAAALATSAERVFPGEKWASQRAAALAAAQQWTTVLTGGPGTGKTTAVAGMLTLLLEQTPGLRVALAAPTGKAAARLHEAVEQARHRFSDQDDRDRIAGLTASTLHRLLGWRPDSRTRFRHDRTNRLPHDVIVVDETSMVSLTMMARLLEAVRPGTRLILVGDADQLASVEAGAVLDDLGDGLARISPTAVVRLKGNHRFGPAIGALAAAIRDQQPDEVMALLRADSAAIQYVDPETDPTLAGVRERLAQSAYAIQEAAAHGDVTSALAHVEAHRLLCAHREGPRGVRFWNNLAERSLGERLGQLIGGAVGREWYAGRPVLITTNDYGQDLFNGDTGVVVADGDGLRAHVSGKGRAFATSRLGEVETLFAMTVHKSQGSQAHSVTVLLPEPDSPLLTRELFYTAVTRAQEIVRVVGSEESIRAAVTRRAGRASGLKDRLTAAADAS